MASLGSRVSIDTNKLSTKTQRKIELSPIKREDSQYTNFEPINSHETNKQTIMNDINLNIGGNKNSEM